eukprot:m.162979 g.162979  ORF g.162979 m.162979 type:complete len:82 (+) comp14615_c0_seq8:2402-2647(+)
MAQFIDLDPLVTPTHTPAALIRVNKGNLDCITQQLSPRGTHGMERGNGSVLVFQYPHSSCRSSNSVFSYLANCEWSSTLGW